MGVGLFSWPAEPFATVGQADAYAIAHAWADWVLLDDEVRQAALLDADTWIRVSFTAPAPWTPAVADAVQSAVIEAARLAAQSPLIGGAAAGEAGIKSVKAGSVSVEFTDAKAAELSASRLVLVRAMLRAAGAKPIGGGVNISLAKS